MLTHTVPQWVEQSFIRSVIAAGGTADHETIVNCYKNLVEMWSQPERYHHDIRHLLDMLTRIDTVAPETPHADWVRLAAWFHGVVFSTSDLAVYTRNGGEDEVASAKLADEYLNELGIGEDVRKAVTKMIVGLKKPHQIDSGPAPEGPKPGETSTFEMIDMDQLALRDAHLGALAVKPQKYKHYLAEIREEYAHIPERHFYRARIKILSKLLARKKLFHSPLATQWEEPARENLEAELDRIKTTLEKLEQALVTEKTALDSAMPVTENQTPAPENQAPLPENQTPAPENQTPVTEKIETKQNRTLNERPSANSNANPNAKSSATLSSLEKIDDIFSPGPAPHTDLTPEQAALEERKKTAASAWKAIITKNNA